MSKYITQELKSEVESLLRKHPALADEPTRLAFNVLSRIAQRYTSSEDAETVNKGLKILNSIEIPAIESITRCSRKLQEEKPELRGRNYESRKQKAKQVREEMIK